MAAPRKPRFFESSLSYRILRFIQTYGPATTAEIVAEFPEGGTRGAVDKLANRRMLVLENDKMALSDAAIDMLANAQIFTSAPVRRRKRERYYPQPQTLNDVHQRRRMLLNKPIDALTPAEGSELFLWESKKLNRSLKKMRAKCANTTR